MINCNRIYDAFVTLNFTKYSLYDETDELHTDSKIPFLVNAILLISHYGFNSKCAICTNFDKSYDGCYISLSTFQESFCRFYQHLFSHFCKKNYMYLNISFVAFFLLSCSFLHILNFFHVANNIIL